MPIVNSYNQYVLNNFGAESVMINIEKSWQDFHFFGSSLITLAGDLTISPSGTPQTGQIIRVFFYPRFDLNGFDFTFFGRTVTASICDAPTLATAFYTGAKWEIMFANTYEDGAPKLKPQSVLPGDIANDAVTTPTIAEDAVTTPAILDGAVTPEKLADDNRIELVVLSTNIINGTIRKQVHIPYPAGCLLYGVHFSFAQASTGDVTFTYYANNVVIIPSYTSVTPAQGASGGHILNLFGPVNINFNTYFRCDVTGTANDGEVDITIALFV
jgi:hypothetical protein